ncbi:MAG: putative sugar nucleotidyl transferase [Fuerstiella sp.]
MRWIVFEDSKADDLASIALLRPVFELLCGRKCLRERLQEWFPGSDWGALVRPRLAEVYQEQHPGVSVNRLSRITEFPTFWVNGRWMPDQTVNEIEVTADTAGFIDGELVWIALEPEESALLTDENRLETLQSIARLRRVVEASGELIARPWDLVNRNSKQLVLDFQESGCSQFPENAHVQCLGDPTDLYISELADVDPYVVIDVRQGPVSIDRDVQIQSFTRIEGPCHIGAGSRIFRALIHKGTTIGPMCRVGGEIEESILHGFVNKYHEGFLGHSYVCPWVNLGAISTTSDLKSNYSSVKVPLQGELVDSGLIKVGSFIGDHTKVAVDSMFNTGTSVGVMAMVVPGGRLLPRHIPSFCSVQYGHLSDAWPLEESLASCRIAMGRRDQVLTAGEEQLLRQVYEDTADERVAAMTRVTAKNLERS